MTNLNRIFALTQILAGLAGIYLGFRELARLLKKEIDAGGARASYLRILAKGARAGVVVAVAVASVLMMIHLERSDFEESGFFLFPLVMLLVAALTGLIVGLFLAMIYGRTQTWLRSKKRKLRD